jgi:1,4-dihydroxy-2-naphthoate octaprenyltransferase
MASRPATLPAAIAPVLAGTAAASWAPITSGAAFDFQPGAFVAAMIGAVLIQIATNFANDYADFGRGADSEQRLGPTRVTQAGLVSAGQIRFAIAVTFSAAAGVGIYLIVVAGWPVLVAGGAAILAGYFYTGGPWPYGYHGLGDVFVFVFFGLVAVIGSYFVQVERITWEAVAAALAVGLPVTAILVINNLRDVETDRASGKRTLAVIVGPHFARVEYALLLATAFALVPIFAAAELMPWTAMLAWMAAPLAVRLVVDVHSGLAGGDLNVVLRQTGLVHLAFGALLAVGYLL